MADDTPPTYRAPSKDGAAVQSPLSYISSTDNDNPFLRQLEFMLSKSATNRVASSPKPSLPQAKADGTQFPRQSDGRSRKWPSGTSSAVAEPPAAKEARPLEFVSGEKGDGKGGGGRKGAKARPSNGSTAVKSRYTHSGVILSPDTKVPWETSRTRPEVKDGDASMRSALPATPTTSKRKSLFEVFNFDSSDDEDEIVSWTAFREKLSLNPESTPSADPPATRSSSWKADSKSAGDQPRLSGSVPGGQEGGGSASPGPSSDGGWPESKRCPPPNLQVFQGQDKPARIWSASASDMGGSGRGVKGRGRCSKATRLVTSIPSRSSSQIDAEPRSRAAVSNVSGSVDDRKLGVETNITMTKTPAGSALHEGDWMSDAEDRGQLSSAAANETPSSLPRASLKRGRREVNHSLAKDSGHSSDSESNCGGNKAGRRVNCSTPARQRPRSSSLSLTPPCSTAFDDKYDSADDAASGYRPGLKRAAGGRGRGLDTSTRGLKRPRDEILDTRIEALRVNSDNDDPRHRGGSCAQSGGQGVRNGGNAIEAAGSTKYAERHGRPCRGAQRTRKDCADDVGDATDGELDDLDDGDLKPELEKPTWLGPLEPFPLGGGGVINPSINRYLRGYQRDGVKWLYTKYVNGQGGLLGDDMGLGKTVQSITLLAAALRKTGTGRDRKELRERCKQGVPASASGHPWLIVAPASVVRVWMEHLAQWGHFAAFHLESRRDVDGLMDALSAGRIEVVAMSYDLMRSFANQLKGILFDAVLFDEFHTLKSSRAMVSRAASELRTSRVFGLTGTLIQNDAKELWALMHLIDPLAMGEKARFSEHFTEPIKRSRAINATPEDQRLAKKRANELDLILTKNMIRRDKEEVLWDLLKGKSDTVVFCGLSEVQRDLYTTVLGLPEFQLLKRSKEPCDCGRRGNPRRARCCYKIPVAEEGDGGDGIDPRAMLFRKYHPTLAECPRCPSCCQLVAVSKLQKIANHPCLLQENLRDSEKTREHQRAFAEVAFSDAAKEAMGGLQRSEKFLDMSKTNVCGKMASLEILLAKFESTRDKVLVFSWSTTMLDVLESFVGAKGYVYRRLDGTTSPKERQTRIQEFNSDRHGVFVFLVSTRAGGQGVNLNMASRVVLYDVNWNPALELQAQDRAYRIGQKNKVAVFRLISKGTIEELCYMRQIYKLQLISAVMSERAQGGRRQFHGVQGEKDQQGELFGIQNLLRYSSSSILKDLRKKYDELSATGAVRSLRDGDDASKMDSDAAPNAEGGLHLVGDMDAADQAEMGVLVYECAAVSTQPEKTIGSGGSARQPDGELLADLPDILGLEAYTHDQLVAKDERQEEVLDDSSDAELETSKSPYSGRKNVHDHEAGIRERGREKTRRVSGAATPSTALARITASKRRSRVIPGTPRDPWHGAGVAEQISARNDHSCGQRRRRKARSTGCPGVIPPLQLEQASKGHASDKAGKTVVSTARGLIPASVSDSVDDGQPATNGTDVLSSNAAQMVSPLQQQSKPAKKRRNLDWGKSRGQAIVDLAGVGKDVGGRGAVSGLKLFTPGYAKSGSGEGKGGSNGRGCP